jgi:pimeloyl-ACP methyl ester carboxylesterase
MNEMPLCIPSHGDTLIGDLHRAPGATDGVLLLPGWSGTRYGPQRILLEAAQAIAIRGYTTLRIDFRGRGDSTGDPAATLDGMIDDAIAAVDWLRTEHGIARVSLVGLCSGGNVALGAASRLTDVGHVVCWSLLPFMEHKAQAVKQGTPRLALLRQYAAKLLRPETWRKLLRGEANVKGAVQTLAKDKEGDDAERRRKTSARDILGDLHAFGGQLHLLYGSRDPEAAGSRAFFEDWCRRQRIPVDVHIIDGAPHNFYTAAWTAEVVAQTAAWLDLIK